jgi:hypothetical protein
VNLGSNVNTCSNEASPAIFDGDETGGTALYFDSNRPGGLGPVADDPPAHNGNAIYSSTLLSDESFASAQLVPVNVPSPVNSGAIDAGPALSFDARTLYFQSNRTGGIGAFDLWVTTRTKVTAQDKPEEN